jgi:hypothetical protein
MATGSRPYLCRLFMLRLVFVQKDGTQQKERYTKQNERQQQSIGRLRSFVGVLSSAQRSLALERRRKNADDSNAVCRPRQMKRPTRK